MAQQFLGQPAALAGSLFLLELVDEIDEIEEPPPGASADHGASDGNAKIGFAGAGAADEDGVVLSVEEGLAPARPSCSPRCERAIPAHGIGRTLSDPRPSLVMTPFIDFRGPSSLRHGLATSTPSSTWAIAEDRTVAGGRNVVEDSAKERVPLVKETLEVGKRQTEERYRVRIYPAEHRVQETVSLRDERVVVEHKPTEAYTPTERDLAPREIEVIERHEHPVAMKRVTATEEVVVHKDVRERTETVSDVVRETKVNVEKKPAQP